MTDAEDQKLEETILPLVQFAKKNSKFIPQLAARLTLRCPNRPPSRQLVEQWLRREADKRKQPRLGMGLVLIEEAAKLMAEMGGNGS